METVPLAEVLDAKADQIAMVLVKLIEEQAFSADLQALRRPLLDVLELIQRNPGIEAASDDLYEVARAYVAAREGTEARHRQPGRERMLAEAFTRYRDRLGSARPNAFAWGAGLV